MTKVIWILSCSVMLWGCSETSEVDTKKDSETNENTTVSKQPVNPEDLVEVKGNTYTEYYDAEKTKIKFQGEQDAEKRRHGKWVHYFENGKQAGITFYTNGIRNGYSEVRRPNGAMYYHGTYKEDKPSGIWKYYDEAGNVTREHNYDKK